MIWRRGVGLAVLMGVVALPAAVATTADAGDQHTLRIATLAPRNSSAGRIFAAWNKQLGKLTDRRVRIKAYVGGVAGDERVVVRKMKLKQLDGGGLTTVGLGLVVRPSLVLQAPGLISNYRQMNAVQDKLNDHFDGLFDRAGYKLLGFGDAGRTRFFSSAAPIRRPADLKNVRPWAWTDDAIYPAMLKHAGANAVALGLPEVMGALQTRMVDTVPASAYMAVGLQWFNVLKYAASRSDSFIVGALIVRKEVYDAMPKDLQEVVYETAYRNQKKIRDTIRREDDKAFKVLQKRGVKVVDVSPHASEWDQLNSRTTQSLVGKIYPQSLLDQVVKVTQAAK